MNNNTDNLDEGSELQAVMGAYFDALLQESAAVLQDVMRPVAVTVADQNLNSASEPQTTAVTSYQMIQVGGLTLGVPTDAIADITALPVTTAPEAVAPTWLLGTAALSQGPMNIVDTASLLMPNTGHRIRTNGGYIVLLRGERWALACDFIGDVLTPDPSQVHWRGAEGKRLWLAGTIRTPSGALLDIPQLINLLSA